MSVYGFINIERTKGGRDMRTIRFISVVTVFASIALIGMILAGPPAGKEVSGKEALAEHRSPVKALEVYLDAFHFHNGEIEKQMEIHHYCSRLNEDVIQCALFDGNTAGARLVGVEYVISEQAFKTLPDEERKMWHSHVYEVKSGQLISPGLSDEAERELMKKIISTYGKTWHTWSTEHMNDRLPLGVPSLMRAFTKDGQAHPALIERRDKFLSVSTDAEKKVRADMEAPAVQPGADAWQDGKAFQPRLMPVSP
jgi:hypothetical protein